MTRFLTVAQVVRLHRFVIEQGHGASASFGIRDVGGLESAVAQPAMTFGGTDLYPQLTEKAAALGYSLIGNHPFVDGNKRVGHAAMEMMLVLNGFELAADIDEAERVILGIAAGTLDRAALLAFVEAHLTRRRS